MLFHSTDTFLQVMDEWLLFNVNSAIFQLSWPKQVNFQRYDDEIFFVLDQHA
jgi:hypothetical protein